MMPRAVVVGMDGFIGSRLCEVLRSRSFEVIGTSRRGGGVHLDLADPPEIIETAAPHVVYLCAAIAKFIDCEANPDAYRINVDAPIAVAKLFKGANIVYLSSEAVEKALHTNYGIQKALCEQGLRTVCDPVIVRLSKVTPETVGRCCEFLASMAHKPPGIYRWPQDDDVLKAVA